MARVDVQLVELEVGYALPAPLEEVTLDFGHSLRQD